MEYQHTEQSPASIHAGNSLSLANVLNEQPTKAHTHSANAIRLINTKGLSRSEWLAMRKQGIGGSDAASAVGLNPYQSQLELWMIKTGRFSEDSPDESETKPNIDSKMYWGQVLEPIVAQHYTKVTGRKVRKVNAILQHADSDKAWMLANIDYRVIGSDEVQLLECKTAGEYGAKLWKDGVPEYVQCVRREVV